MYKQFEIEVPWMTYLADFEENGGLCRAYAYPIEDAPNLPAVNKTKANWFTAQKIQSLQSVGKLDGGHESRVIKLWLDDSYVRGIGQSKNRTAAGRA